MIDLRRNLRFPLLPLLAFALAAGLALAGCGGGGGMFGTNTAAEPDTIGLVPPGNTDAQNAVLVDGVPVSLGAAVGFRANARVCGYVKDDSRAPASAEAALAQTGEGAGLGYEKVMVIAGAKLFETGVNDDGYYELDYEVPTNEQSPATRVIVVDGDGSARSANLFLAADRVHMVNLDATPAADGTRTLAVRGDDLGDYASASDLDGLLSGAPVVAPDPAETAPVETGDPDAAAAPAPFIRPALAGSPVTMQAAVNATLAAQATTAKALRGFIRVDLPAAASAPARAAGTATAVAATVQTGLPDARLVLTRDGIFGGNAASRTCTTDATGSFEILPDEDDTGFQLVEGACTLHIYSDLLPGGSLQQAVRIERADLGYVKVLPEIRVSVAAPVERPLEASAGVSAAASVPRSLEAPASLPPVMAGEWFQLKKIVVMAVAADGSKTAVTPSWSTAAGDNGSIYSITGYYAAPAVNDDVIVKLTGRYLGLTVVVDQPVKSAASVNSNFTNLQVVPEQTNPSCKAENGYFLSHRNTPVFAHFANGQRVAVTPEWSASLGTLKPWSPGELNLAFSPYTPPQRVTVTAKYTLKGVTQTGWFNFDIQNSRPPSGLRVRNEKLSNTAPFYFGGSFDLRKLLAGASVRILFGADYLFTDLPIDSPVFKWSASAGTVSGMVYTPPASGTSGLTVNLLCEIEAAKMAAILPVGVRPVFLKGIELDQKEVRLPLGKTFDCASVKVTPVMLQGGPVPVKTTWSASSGTLSGTLFTPPDDAEDGDTATLTATFAFGDAKYVAHLPVTIVNDMTLRLVPGTLILTAGESLDLAAKVGVLYDSSAGSSSKPYGTPGFQWSASAGTLSPAGILSVPEGAPASAGLLTLSYTNLGKTATATAEILVKTLAGLRLSTTAEVYDSGSAFDLTRVKAFLVYHDGAFAPATAAWSAAKGSVTGTTFTYTVPGFAEETVTLTATARGKSETLTLTARPAVQKIALSATERNVVCGERIVVSDLPVTATFGDGVTTAPVAAAWSASAGAIEGNALRVYTVPKFYGADTVVTLTATYQGKTAALTLRVKALPALTRLELADLPATVYPGETIKAWSATPAALDPDFRAFTAVAFYSDGTTKEVEAEYIDANKNGFLDRRLVVRRGNEVSGARATWFDFDRKAGRYEFHARHTEDAQTVQSAPVVVECKGLAAIKEELVDYKVEPAVYHVKSGTDTALRLSNLKPRFTFRDRGRLRVATPYAIWRIVAGPGDLPSSGINEESLFYFVPSLVTNDRAILTADLRIGSAANAYDTDFFAPQVTVNVQAKKLTAFLLKTKTINVSSGGAVALEPMLKDALVEFNEEYNKATLAPLLEKGTAKVEWKADEGTVAKGDIPGSYATGLLWTAPHAATAKTVYLRATIRIGFQTGEAIVAATVAASKPIRSFAFNRPYSLTWYDWPESGRPLKSHLHPTVTYTDGSTAELSPAWSVTKGKVVGDEWHFALANPRVAETVTITGTLGGFTASHTVKIQPDTPASLEIVPARYVVTSVPAGKQISFDAYCKFESYSQRKVTGAQFTAALGRFSGDVVKVYTAPLVTADATDTITATYSALGVTVTGKWDLRILAKAPLTEFELHVADSGRAAYYTGEDIVLWERSDRAITQPRYLRTLAGFSGVVELNVLPKVLAGENGATIFSRRRSDGVFEDVVKLPTDGDATWVYVRADYTEGGVTKTARHEIKITPAAVLASSFGAASLSRTEGRMISGTTARLDDIVADIRTDNGGIGMSVAPAWRTASHGTLGTAPESARIPVFTAPVVSEPTAVKIRGNVADRVFTFTMHVAPLERLSFTKPGADIFPGQKLYFSKSNGIEYFYVNFPTALADASNGRFETSGTAADGTTLRINPTWTLGPGNAGKLEFTAQGGIYTPPANPAPGAPLVLTAAYGAARKDFTLTFRENRPTGLELLPRNRVIAWHGQKTNLADQFQAMLAFADGTKKEIVPGAWTLPAGEPGAIAAENGAFMYQAPELDGATTQRPVRIGASHLASGTLFAAEGTLTVRRPELTSIMIQVDQSSYWVFENSTNPLSHFKARLYYSNGTSTLYDYDKTPPGFTWGFRNLKSKTATHYTVGTAKDGPVWVDATYGGKTGSDTIKLRPPDTLTALLYEEGISGVAGGGRFNLDTLYFRARYASGLLRYAVRPTSWSAPEGTVVGDEWITPVVTAERMVTLVARYTHEGVTKSCDVKFVVKPSVGKTLLLSVSSVTLDPSSAFAPARDVKATLVYTNGTSVEVTPALWQIDSNHVGNSLLLVNGVVKPATPALRNIPGRLIASHPSGEPGRNVTATLDVLYKAPKPTALRVVSAGAESATLESGETLRLLSPAVTATVTFADGAAVIAEPTKWELKAGSAGSLDTVPGLTSYRAPATLAAAAAMLVATFANEQGSVTREFPIRVKPEVPVPSAIAVRNGPLSVKPGITVDLRKSFEIELSYANPAVPKRDVSALTTYASTAGFVTNNLFLHPNDVDAKTDVTLAVEYVDADTGKKLTVQAVVSVNPLVFTSLAIAPAAASVDGGAAYDLSKVVATATMDTGATRTPGLAWALAQGSGGAISGSTYTAPSLLTASTATLVASAAYGGVTKTANLVLSVAPVLGPTALALAPGGGTVNAGQTFDLAAVAATATMSDGTARAVTPAWSVAPGSGGTIAGSTYNAPLVDADGAATLVASYMLNGFTATANLALAVKYVPPPSVLAVSSSTPDGTYGFGQALAITVAFSEAVTVTGAPQLTLAFANADRIATYASGSGTDTLTFAYTVQAGDRAADLDYKNASALALNGGSIRNAAGTAALLTLPAPGAAGSLGAAKALAIDATAPTALALSPASGSVNAKATFDLSTVAATATMSDATTRAVTPTWTLAQGAPGSLSGSTYTAPDTIADGTATLVATYALNGGTATSNLVLSVVAPTPVVTAVSSTTADGTYGKDQALAITVTFDLPVTVTGAPQLTLNFSGVDRAAAYASGSGTTTLTFAYTTRAGDVTADLDYKSASALAASGGTIRSAGGKDANLTLPAPGAAGSLGANKALAVDAGPAVLPDSLALSVSTGSVTGVTTFNLATVTATCTYTDASTKTVTPVWTVNQGSVGTISGATYTSVAVAQATAVSLTATYEEGGVAKTAAFTLTVNPPAFDNTIPVITNVSSTKPNGTYGADTAIDITVQFDEAVFVTGTPKLALNIRTAAREALYASGSGTATLTFRYTVQAGDYTPDLDYPTTQALTLNGGSIRDAAGNPAGLSLIPLQNKNSLGYNKSIVVNAPAEGALRVIRVQGYGSVIANGSSSAGIQVVFSGNVTVTGTPRLKLEVGSVLGTPAYANYASGSGTAILTFTYIPVLGETSSDLEYTGSDALELNGGTIDADVTLPAPYGPGSLSATSDIWISNGGNDSDWMDYPGAPVKWYFYAVDTSVPRDGVIDAVEFSFTERVKDSTVNPADFRVAKSPDGPWDSGASFSTSVVVMNYGTENADADDHFFTIALPRQNVVTGERLYVMYAGTTFTGVDGTPVTRFGPAEGRDFCPPALVSVGVENGGAADKLDSGDIVTFEFSEPLTGTSWNAYQNIPNVNLPEPAAGDVAAVHVAGAATDQLFFKGIGWISLHKRFVWADPAARSVAATTDPSTIWLDPADPRRVVYRIGAGISLAVEGGGALWDGASPAAVTGTDPSPTSGDAAAATFKIKDLSNNGDSYYDPAAQSGVAADKLNGANY